MKTARGMAHGTLVESPCAAAMEMAHGTLAESPCADGDSMVLHAFGGWWTGWARHSSGSS